MKTLEEGQTLFKTLTERKATSRQGGTEDAESGSEPRRREEPKLPRFEQVIQEGGKAKRVIWVEIGEDKWKSFDTEKDAEEYKPTSDAPKAGGVQGDWRINDCPLTGRRARADEFYAARRANGPCKER